MSVPISNNPLPASNPLSSNTNSLAEQQQQQLQYDENIMIAAQLGSLAQNLGLDSGSVGSDSASGLGASAAGALANADATISSNGVSSNDPLNSQSAAYNDPNGSRNAASADQLHHSMRALVQNTSGVIQPPRV